MQKKDDKVGNKTVNNEEGKGEKKSERDQIDLQKNNPKKTSLNLSLCTCVKNKKAV